LLVVTAVAPFAASAGIWAWASKNRAGRAAAWWWFGSLAFLLPVSGLVPLGSTSLADRYVYLPSIGPCVYVALGAAWLAARHPNPAISTMCVLLLGAGLVTHDRAKCWKNSVALWRRTVDAYPQCKFAWPKPLFAYVLDGKPTKAISVCRDEGLKNVPGDLDLSISVAALLQMQERLPEAEKILADAETYHPQNAQLANQRAKIAMQREQFDEALRLARILYLQRLGRGAEAEQTGQNAIRYVPPTSLRLRS
jgi:hypothetical protein